MTTTYGVPRRISRALVGLVVAATTVLMATGTGVPRAAAGTDPGTDPGTVAAPSYLGTTTRISTFNVLGYDHTVPGGNKRGWASGTQRIKWAYQLLNSNGIDIVGFQEFQRPQMDQFVKMAGSKWTIWPGASLGKPSIANNIGWRTAEWTMVAHGHIKVPYFKGAMIAMPWVLLQSTQTGRQIYVYNSHNPADTRGPAKKYRNRDVGLEIALVAQLRAANPGIPVFITGDKNDRANYFCPMARAGMQASNGGSATPTSCTPPAGASIDWILGTSQVRFTNYHSIRNAKVRKTTDHHLIYSDVYIPSEEAVASPVKHVVVISVDGLNRRTVASGTQMPTLRSMIADGVWTPGARTDHDSVDAMSNNVSMLTGLRASRKYGGHGFSGAGQHKASLTAAAGRYLSSALGITHDFGAKTALISSNPLVTKLHASWARGASDPYVPDNGRNKIGRYTHAAGDKAALEAALEIFEHRAQRFAFIEFSAPMKAARAQGPKSAAYASAARKTDHRVKKILQAISAKPAFDQHTVVIVTSSRGWAPRQRHPNTRAGNFNVPIIITGPGVPAGADLYTLNPQYSHASYFTNPAYKAAGQPIRTGDIANLVTRLLGEPAIPGSTMNSAQSLTIFAPQPPAPTSTP